MPQIDEGNNLGQMLTLYQIMQNMKARQAQNLLATASPGSTVGELNMDPGTYAVLFGKGTKYDPNRVLSPMTDSQRALHAYIGTMTPSQLQDFGASIANTSVGTPGATTVAGAEASRQTGGSKAQVAQQIQVKTAPDQVKTGVAQEQTKAAQAEDIMQRTIKGIESMSKAPTDVQDAVNQQVAYGTTVSGQQVQSLKNRMAITSMEQALKAQQDPNHPLNRFLSKLGLDMPTVLAGSAMGLDGLMGSVVQYGLEAQRQGREAQNIMLRADADYANRLSTLMGNKVTPQQIMAVMNAKQTGGKIPPSLQGISSLIDNATEVYFRAGITEAQEKGDPDAQALSRTLQALQTVKDPTQLKAMGQLIRQDAARIKTNQQIGPLTQQNSAHWTQVYNANLNLTQGIDVEHNYIMPNEYNVVGGPTGASAGPAIPDAIASQLSPSTRAAMTGKPNPNQPALPFSGPAAQTQGISPEDAANVQLYLQSIGMGSQQPTTGQP